MIQNDSFIHSRLRIGFLSLLLGLPICLRSQPPIPAAWSCSRTASTPTTSAQTICTALRNLYASVWVSGQAMNANYALAVDKLSLSNLSNDALLEIVQTIQNWSLAPRSAFLADLVAVPLAGTTANHLSQNVNNLSLPILAAWNTLYQASNNLNYKTDFKSLQQIVTLRSPANATNYQLLGGDVVLADLISKYIGVNGPCNTCQNSRTYMRFLDMYLNDVQNFVIRFGRNTGGNRSNFVFTSGLASGKKGHVLGAAFMVKVLAINPVYVPTAFEVSYPAPAGSTTGGCEADAVMGSRILEFKSWSPNTSDTDIGSMNDGDIPTLGRSIFMTFSENSYSNPNTNSYTQLLCYLRSINNMNNLTYIFDRDLLLSKGQSDPLAYVRGNFQTLFQRPVEQQQIFNTIWNNLPLRQQLYPQPANQNATTWQPIARQNFTNAINNGSFFSFITTN